MGNPLERTNFYCAIEIERSRVSDVAVPRHAIVMELAGESVSKEISARK